MGITVSSVIIRAKIIQYIKIFKNNRSTIIGKQDCMCYNTFG